MRGCWSLADAWADTTTPHGKLMITILGGLAEFERELIRARTGEGRKRAQARGVRFGRKLELTPYQRQEALAAKGSGRALVRIARTFGVSHSTISRLNRASSSGRAKKPWLPVPRLRYPSGQDLGLVWRFGRGVSRLR